MVFTPPHVHYTKSIHALHTNVHVKISLPVVFSSIISLISESVTFCTSSVVFLAIFDSYVKKKSKQNEYLFILHLLSLCHIHSSDQYVIALTASFLVIQED